MERPYYRPRNSNDVLRGDTCPFWWFWQLLHAVADRRTRHGLPAHEQPFVLDVRCGNYTGNLFGVGTGRQRSAGIWRRVGVVSTAVDQRAGHVDGSCHLCRARFRRVVDFGRDQYDHNVPEHARTGHVTVQSATVLLVDFCYVMVDSAFAASFGGRNHNAADGSQFWLRLF